MRRRNKLHIPRFRASAKARPFRCFSSPNVNRFAGFTFGFKAPAAPYIVKARRLCREGKLIGHEEARGGTLRGF
mgnify:CR=1 FL=1